MRAALRLCDWLISVERDDQLIGCVEVRPSDRRVRQALGLRNQPLRAEIADDVLATLRLCGIARV